MTRQEEIKCAAARFAIKDTETNGRVRKDYVISAMGDHEAGFNEGFVAGANWADKFPRETREIGARKQNVVTDVWVARDKDGGLYIYDNKPGNNGKEFLSNRGSGSYMAIRNQLFADITFENSPVKMRLILEENYE
jgi:hypothetical protein